MKHYGGVAFSLLSVAKGASRDENASRRTGSRATVHNQLRSRRLVSKKGSSSPADVEYEGIFGEAHTFGSFHGLPSAIPWGSEGEEQVEALLDKLHTMIQDGTEAGTLLMGALVSICNPLLVPKELGRCDYWAQYDGIEKTMVDFFREWMYYTPIPQSVNTVIFDPLNEPDSPGWYNMRWGNLVYTQQGRKLVLNKEFKAWIKDFLNLHALYLDSPDSWANYPGKSFGPFELWDTYGGTTNHPFSMDTYVVPAENGFESYSQFFLRELKAGIRPQEGDGDETIITSPCDCGMFYLSHGEEVAEAFMQTSELGLVQHELPGKSGDTFGIIESIPGFGWAFAGGKLFDFLLWFTDYHHFHAPVSGTIVYKERIPGAYDYGDGNFNPDRPRLLPPPATSNRVQWYETIDKHTRYSVVIDTGEDNMGLVAMIPVGFWTVGTMEYYPEVGDYIKKGDHVGHFLYGGSSIVLAFEPGRDLSFVHNGIEISGPDRPRLVKVKSEIGRLVKDDE